MRIPSELLRSIPRDIKLTAAGKAVTAVAAVLLVASVVVSGWLYALALRADAQGAASVSTDGQVVRLSATRGDHPRWSATYRYEADGRSFEGTSRLGRVDRQRLALGDTLPVRYLPTDPETHWIEGYQADRVSPAVAPAAFLPMVVAGVLLLVRMRREMSLLSDGRAAIGIVTGSRRMKGSHSRNDVQRVTFEYRLLSGGVRTGRFETRKAAPPAGSEIVVVYDPDNPKRSRKYPLPLVKCDTPS